MADEIARESCWTREQDRAFENALVAYPDEDSEDRWEKIATNVVGKSVEEIKHHYELLIDDLDRIESGIVPLPCYSASSDDSASLGGDDGISKKGGNSGHRNSESVHGCKAASKADQERRKGVAWTEDEHRLFLLGLERYGKGDWRSISRNFVVTRTPTQVASHAQKYFIRLNSMNRDRRRSSIHDITSVSNGDTSAPQAAITGQTNTSLAGKSSNQSPQVASDPSSPTVSMYGGTVGLAIGTPVTLPPPPTPTPLPPHIAYGIRAPGHVVPGAPMNVSPMTYPMLKTSSRR